ncbi:MULTISPECIES: hypothetical protein [Bacteroides]|jgi:hypothetical protein|uniref:Baseplate protein J-like domain-containing protein n=2 Tax=Bacteroides TaxID=816 RepID=A0A5M5EH38_BACOV|nr:MULTISPECIES: hypothetical protein [Bacteroides]DAN50867.1 MAG TPA: Baseplate structural protein [Caudoviricetes sp.]KAA4010670.1 hypothetical protein F3F37_06870 [Bacteroides ovatus]KAA4010861.1 hypothetical protein F3D64_06745 [Bacteroides ovatus]KAA4019272.1 hypothetical protein F3D53_08180 [Bacteroides ovatus]KAA4028306.1 hypothetical protein F3D52_15760 [Bacteroides ovatus]
MSRTLTEIYNEAVETRSKYLELTELTNDSKMSIINAFTWVTAAAIYSFETLLDVFTTDIAKTFTQRINGTSAYYANAMLKWQYGDDLIINDEGTAFHYATEDTTKRLITHVSYQEYYNEEFKDNILILKVATGEGSSLSQLSDEELIAARAYLNQIKFAGVKCNVVSRRGDVLVPRVTVYYDGAITKEELYDNIDTALIDFIVNMKFDSLIYSQKIIDAIQKVEHVTDVHIDHEASVEQGIFIAQYNDNNELGPLTKIERKCYLASGYAKQSTQQDAESELPTFREAIVIKLETE